MNGLRAFLQDEEGQATTEYILMLSIITSMLVLLVKKLITPMFTKMTASLTSRIEKEFLGADLHVFRIRR